MKRALLWITSSLSVAELVEVELYLGRAGLRNSRAGRVHGDDYSELHLLEHWES